jgi:hypothetical protein
VVLVVGIALSGVFWLRENKDRLREEAVRVGEEGAEAGRSLGESECLDQTLEHYRDAENPVNAIRQGVWMRGCLETSRFETTFCRGVPSTDEILATATWRVSRCDDAGFDAGSNCKNILGQVQKYCESAERRAKQ